MIDGSRIRGDDPRSPAHFARLLQTFYQDLLDQGVPDHLARLVQRYADAETHPVRNGRRLAIVVEPEDEMRRLAATLLEETGLATVECLSAEEALVVLQQRGGEIAFVFADQHLAGPRDGIDLVRSTALLWPRIHLVLTSDEDPAGMVDLPDGVVALPKPWRGLDVLMAAERALAGERRTADAQ